MTAAVFLVVGAAIAASGIVIGWRLRSRMFWDLLTAETECALLQEMARYDLRDARRMVAQWKANEEFQRMLQAMEYI